MEVSENVYKEVTLYKINTREYANRARNVRKRNGGESASTTNPKKGCSGKRKKNHAVHPSNCPTSDKTCLVHGSGNSTEDCKVLKEYSEKYHTQLNCKEARYGGKKNHGKYVKLDAKTQEFNIIVFYTEPAPKKKRKNQKKRNKIEPDNA